MRKITDVELVGQSGTKYDFEIYPIGTRFGKNVAAVYAVLKQVPDPRGKTQTYIYIEETGNLRETFESHPKKVCFGLNGATCICIHQDDKETSRIAKEDDLRRTYNWICNRE